MKKILISDLSDFRYIGVSWGAENDSGVHFGIEVNHTVPKFPISGQILCCYNNTQISDPGQQSLSGSPLEERGQKGRREHRKTREEREEKGEKREKEKEDKEKEKKGKRKKRRTWRNKRRKGGERGENGGRERGKRRGEQRKAK